MNIRAKIETHIKLLLEAMQEEIAPHHYGLELTDNDPQADTPINIKVPLKPHQKAALAKAISFEQQGGVHYHLPHEIQEYMHRRSTYYRGRLRIVSNIGICGDVVGFGKTLTALSIIAATPVRNIYRDQEVIVTSYGRHIGSFKATLERPSTTTEDKTFHTTLVVVPHGPVFEQWRATIEQQTSLKALILDTLHSIRKLCPAAGCTATELKPFFERYDLVLIKATTIKTLMDYYDVPFRENPITSWGRVMVDEAHDILPKVPMFDFRFLWLISGTYQMIPQRLYSCRGMCNVVREVMNDDRMPLMLLKGKRDFVTSSFNVPPLQESYHLCHLPTHLSMIQPFLHPSVVERINANDIAGAIRELGGTNETEHDIVQLVTRDLQREIRNKERELQYVESLDIMQDVRDHRLQNLRGELQRLQERMQALTDRVTHLSDKQCAICMENYDNPIMLECTHVFCGPCIIHWIRSNPNRRACPTCRVPIHCKKLTAIVNQKPQQADAVATRPQVLNKEETLLKLLQEKPDGRFLVFSRNDSTFYNVTQRLQDTDITHAEIKGSTSQMMKILERFRSGELRVILLNTYHAGSGIDISSATDVVIFHSMGLDKTQAVGRAQRVGRSIPLHVHNLCYAHEM